MAAALLQEGVSIQCPHGGKATVMTTNTRVEVSGKPALRGSDTFTITGCPFTLPGGKPQPCITIQWGGEAKRAKVMNQSVLLQTSIGLCKSAEGIVQGKAMVSGVQTKTKGM